MNGLSYADTIKVEYVETFFKVCFKYILYTNMYCIYTYIHIYMYAYIHAWKLEPGKVIFLKNGVGLFDLQKYDVLGSCCVLLFGSRQTELGEDVFTTGFCLILVHATESSRA